MLSYTFTDQLILLVVTNLFLFPIIVEFVENILPIGYIWFIVNILVQIIHIVVSVLLNLSIYLSSFIWNHFF
jgi:hypothetical protein